MPRFILTILAMAFFWISTTVVANAEPPAAEGVARSIWIDRIEYNSASLSEAVEHLLRKAQGQLPKGQRFRIEFEAYSATRLSLHRVNKTLFELLVEFSGITGLPLKATEGAIVFTLPAEKAAVPLHHRRNQEDNLREILFRYLFSYEDTDPKSRAAAYFISVGTDAQGNRIDPSEAFLARFKGHKVPVKKSSEGFYDPPYGGVLDKTTKKRGEPFSTGTVQWLSDTKVSLMGEFQEGFNYYELTHTMNDWYVTNVEQGAVH